MSFDVEKLKAKDLEEITLFLNKVFSDHNGFEMHFEEKFPRIFKAIDENMSWHYATRDNGKICGTAASYPLEYKVGDEVLKLSAGGNVAVSSDHRNMGIMQDVMNKIAGDLPEEGFDIAYLHGDRVRYRTFGFERCGVEYSFQFVRPKVVYNEFTFEQVENYSSEIVSRIVEITNSQNSGLIRKAEDIKDSLEAQMRKGYIIKDLENNIVGYFSSKLSENHISEIWLTNKSDFKKIITDFMYFADLKRLVIGLPEYEFEYVKQSIELADRYTIIQPGNFRIINFAKTVRAFMKAKSNYAPLMDGSMVIDSEIFGKWKISFDNGEVAVDETTEDADVILPGHSAYQFIFGTATPIDIENKKIALLATNWFPLPLYCPYLT